MLTVFLFVFLLSDIALGPMDGKSTKNSVFVTYLDL